MTQAGITIAQTSLHKSAYKVARASGADWREVGAKLLQSLESDTKGAAKAQGFTTGFLFISDKLSHDAPSLLHLLQDITGVGVWSGCSGLGVFDHTGINIDEPAAVLMLANFPLSQIMPIALQSQPELVLPDTYKAWHDRHGPPFGLVFVDPFMDQSLNRLLTELAVKAGAFVVGGISSGRDQQQAQIGASATSGQLGGLLLGAEIYVQTALTQGCLPMGDAHVATVTHENMILELDDKPAISVFTEDLRQMAMAQIGEDPDKIMVDMRPAGAIDELDDKIKSFFQGEIHLGVNIAGSDRGDYVVRPIMGIDPDHDHLLLGDPLPEGTVVRFVKRDAVTVKADLQRMLDDLQRRLPGAPSKPAAALYISCVARAPMSGESSDELEQIKAHLGDIPFLGYYAGGEIFRENLHGYTGILTLFF